MVKWRRDRMPLLAVRAWLLLLCSVLLLIQVYTAWVIPEQAFYNVVGLDQTTFLHGQVWGITTHCFFHHPVDWSHFLFNVLMLFYLSGRITHILGSLSCLKVLGLGILVAGTFHLILDPLVRETWSPLIGISGGVCALFSVLCTLDPDTRFFPFMVSGKNLLRASVITTVLFMLLSPQLKIPFLSSAGEYLNHSSLRYLFSIGHACHLGGIIAGIIYARCILNKPKFIF